MKEGERRASAYFAIFNGEVSRLSTIQDQSPQLTDAIQSLERSGKIVGQDVFDETGEVDTLYWLNNNPSREPIVVSHNGDTKPLQTQVRV